jgi:hypothetical protein
MAIIPFVAFDEKLWMVSRKSVWSSVDGIEWRAQLGRDWGDERHGEVYAFFANKMWMLGGMKTWGEFKNDVWFSRNATEWTLAAPHAAWPPRRHNGRERQLGW